MRHRSDPSPLCCIGSCCASGTAPRRACSAQSPPAPSSRRCCGGGRGAAQWCMCGLCTLVCEGCACPHVHVRVRVCARYVSGLCMPPDAQGHVTQPPWSCAARCTCSPDSNRVPGPHGTMRKPLAGPSPAPVASRPTHTTRKVHFSTEKSLGMCTFGAIAAAWRAHARRPGRPPARRCAALLCTCTPLRSAVRETPASCSRPALAAAEHQ